MRAKKTADRKPNEKFSFQPLLERVVEEEEEEEEEEGNSSLRSTFSQIRCNLIYSSFSQRLFNPAIVLSIHLRYSI